MKPLLVLFIIISMPLMAVEKVDPTDPKWLRDKKKAIETTAQQQPSVEKKMATQLYRSWVDPVSSVRSPAAQNRSVEIIRPAVQQPKLEQTFLKSNQWKPGRVVQVYEKSKDFEKVLNPLSLRDFNRFIYQRNPSSP